MSGSAVEYPLIVFEGVDNSGKTTISKRLAEKWTQFRWSKEPVFTTEEADRLNSGEFEGKDAEREVMFLEGRLRQQSLYRNNPVFLDRYLWSGMAYARSFSPSIFDFCVALYQNYNIFKKPTLTFFMETPLKTCQEREPSLTIARLDKIRMGYKETEKYVNTPIVYIDGTKDIDSCVQQCENALYEHVPAYFVK